MNIVNLHIGKLNVCYVAYIYNGGRGETESTLQNHVIYNKMGIELCVQTQSSILRILYGKLYSSYVAYVYNGEFVSLIGNQRVMGSIDGGLLVEPPALVLVFIYQARQNAIYTAKLS